MIKHIFTNSAGILASRIFGLIRDLLTASILGANIYSDIFFVAFKLPNLFRRIFAEGAFTQSFLPAFTRAKFKAQFSARIFLIFLSIIGFLTIVVQLYPKSITSIIAFGFSDELIKLCAPLLAINFFYLALIFVVTFISSLLHYKNHFATTAYSTALLNLAIIGALLLSSELESSKIVYYMSYSVIIGGVIQLFVHILALYKVKMNKIFFGGFKYLTNQKNGVKEQQNRFFKQFIPAVWGNSTAQISAFLDTFLATFLATGTVSYLYYANRIYQLPLALFAIATATALFPSISRHLKYERIDEALKELQKVFWLLLTLLSLSTIGGIIFSEEVIILLFEHGAFTAEDTMQSSVVLQMYLIGLVPFGMAKLFLLWLYADGRIAKGAMIASISLGVNIVLALILFSPLGASGLALAGSLGGVILFILSIKEFGKDRFLGIISDTKKLIIYLSIIIFMAIFFALIKDSVHDYLRFG